MSTITQGDAATPAVGAVPAAANNAPGGDDATNNGANNQQQQQALYQGTFFTGHLPAPTGEVAKYINSSASSVELKARAEACFVFLDDPTSDLRDLNGDTTLFTALIAVPGTQKVKVLYGMGQGTAQIGQVSPVANKMLALFGEGGAELGTPQVLVVPDTIRHKVTVKTLTDATILQAFQGGQQTVDQPVAPAREVTTEASIMRIAPVPAYMIFDGFNDDLDASMVYERLMDVQDRTPMIDHALMFLRSCMIGQWRQQDIRPHIPINEFFGMVHSTARLWANNRFSAVSPFRPARQQAQQQLFPAPQGQVAQIQAPAGPANVFQLDATALQAFFAGASVGTTRGMAEEKKDDAPDFKISEGERARMRHMCGLPDGCGDDMFPKWYRDIFAKNQDEKDKALVVAHAIGKSFIFEDAEVPLYPALLKMILKRDWTGQDVGKRAALAHAAKGLSPFAMVDLTEDDVAYMQQEDDDLKYATTVSASELKAARKNLAAKVPEDAEGLMQMIKRFANMLYALFSSQCPMYKQLYEIVKGLREYSPNARTQLGRKTKASMLWIILLQARRFAQGKMEGDDGCLGEFSNMLNLIKAKNCGTIDHVEVPSELGTSAPPVPQSPVKRKASAPVTTTEPLPKKAKPGSDRVVEPFNEALKTLLDQPRKDAGYPRFGAMCEFCGITEKNLVTGLTTKDCRQFFLTGSCMFGAVCRLHHRRATPVQVREIETKLDRFIKEPLGLKGKTT